MTSSVGGQYPRSWFALVSAYHLAGIYECRTYLADPVRVGEVEMPERLAIVRQVHLLPNGIRNPLVGLAVWIYRRRPQAAFKRYDSVQLLGVGTHRVNAVKTLVVAGNP